MKLVFVVICLSASGCQYFADYMGEVKKIKLTKSGEAQLLEAEQTRKIKIEEAKAELESAKLKSEAEVERAKGVAEANKIIGESLKNNESYLRYLWVNGLNDGTSEVIYVPTEANMPLLESGKRVYAK